MDTLTLQKVQGKMLEVLCELDRVCRQHAISYWLCGGTLLGAVRHGGFIPWDDDVDVAMLRQDYERFCRVAPEALDPRFTFQTWHTDEAYPHPFGKLRMRHTLYVEAKGHRLRENGFYVDVFPYDYAPDEPSERKRLETRLVQLYRIKLMKSGCTPWREGDKTLWDKRIGYLPYQLAARFVSHKKLIDRFEKLVLSVPPSGTMYEQCATTHTVYFNAEWLRADKTLPFAGKELPVPHDSDAFLKRMYGDYWQLPPEEERQNRHQIVELDFGKE